LKQKLLAAMIVGGAIGFTLSNVVAETNRFSRFETQAERYPTKSKMIKVCLRGWPGRPRKMIQI
jgi:hypothetical protein